MADFLPVFRDVRISDRVDRDGDGYVSQFSLEFDVDSNIVGNYYVRVYEDDGSSLFDDFLFQTPSFAVVGASFDYQKVSIATDSFPGIDRMSHGTAELRLDLFDARTNSLVQTWRQANDANLGGIKVELGGDESISPRLMPVIAGARITNRVDQDGDGYASRFDIEFDVHSNDSDSYYVRVYEDDGSPLFDDLLAQSPSFSVNLNAVDVQKFSIVADAHPGTDMLSHGTAEFRLDLYETRSNNLVHSWRSGNDADLGGVNVELSAEDLGIEGSVDGFTVRISRKDISNTQIDVNAPRTWLLIHGLMGSEATFADTANAIHALYPQDQILILDWGDPVSDLINIRTLGFAELVFGTIEDRITKVAEWIAGNIGIEGSTLELVGHSFGSYVAGELAERIDGGVDTIIALDPAANVGGNYDAAGPGGVNFADHSNWSWAFRESDPRNLDLGNTLAALTADEAFSVTGSDHSNIRNMFTNMLQTPSGGNGVNQYFQLQRLLNHQAGPWALNQFDDQGNKQVGGGFEALIAVSGDEVVPANIAFSRYINAGPDNDVLTGDSDGDTIDGGSGNDKIFGADGNDQLRGGAGADRLMGGAGDDHLDGGSSADQLEGGAGDDVYVVDTSTDRISESATEGIDTVESSATYSLAANIENLILNGSGNFRGQGNRENNRLTGNDAANLLGGLGGADSLNGNAGNDTLLGGDGDDTMDGGDGSDRLDGGLGSDTARFAGNRSTYGVSLALGDVVRIRSADGSEDLLINTEMALFDDGAYLIRGSDNRIILAGTEALLANTATYRDDTLTGTEQDDSLDGGDGHDSLSGSAGVDTLLGGNGNDFLDGGNGADTLVGGAGNDSYSVDTELDVISETSLSGKDSGGVDTVQSTVAAWTLGSNVERLQFIGGAVDFRGTGNSLANTITGGSGNDSLDGGLGADKLVGGAGSDTYVIDNVLDRIDDSAGSDDRVLTRLASHTLSAQLEHLSYLPTGSTANFVGTGNGSANRIVGNGGNDRLAGLGGNDSLGGGLGNDVLLGGDGDDILDGGAGINRLDGGAGDDTAVLAGSKADYQVTFRAANQLMLTGNGASSTLLGIERVIFDNNTADTLDDSSIVINTQAATDSTPAGLLYNLPTYLADALIGTSQDDGIDGLGGNDTIMGLGGVDTLIGDAGNDTLIGGGGSDLLTGGAGGDRFVFDATIAPDNVDQIGDFGLGDKVLLAQAIFADLALGALDSAAFFAGLAAHDDTDRLIYDRASGNLFYDADGLGGSDATLIATFGTNLHPVVSAGSFWVI